MVFDDLNRCRHADLVSTSALNRGVAPLDLSMKVIEVVGDQYP